MTKAFVAGPTLGLVLLSGAALATHITDKLAVGLYDAKDAQQPTQLLTSGTPVERLELSGEQCRIRLGGGAEGWLECRYLTDEKPARAMLLEAQAVASRLRQDLEQARRQQTAQRLEQAQLERRLQATESLLGGKVAEQDLAMPVARAEPEADVSGGEEAALSQSWLPVLSGVLIGLVLGAVLLHWRCRRRYGGLRI